LDKAQWDLHEYLTGEPADKKQISESPGSYYSFCYERLTSEINRRHFHPTMWIDFKRRDKFSLYWSEGYFKILDHTHGMLYRTGHRAVRFKYLIESF